MTYYNNNDEQNQNQATKPIRDKNNNNNDNNAVVVVSSTTSTAATNNHSSTNDAPRVAVVTFNESLDDLQISDHQFLQKTIPKLVIRSKLSKQRHLVLPKVICGNYMEQLFSLIRQKFEPQTVIYNGGRAHVPEWKISCYLEVMDGGIPTTHPHEELCRDCLPLLNICNTIFQCWYKQQHSSLYCCNKEEERQAIKVTRLMTFITRYNAIKQGENALLKHVDGAGKVDGSVVVALPTDEPFEGGGLTFWDGNNKSTGIHYDTKPGDITLIDRAVWHQADPITKGIRWALVIFYQVL